MADTKVVFIAFAIEDERQRDLLKGQSLHTKSPFQYIDMSVKEAYDKDWKEKVRTRIKRSDGVIALVSKSTLTSSGEKWCTPSATPSTPAHTAYTSTGCRLPADIAVRK